MATNSITPNSSNSSDSKDIMEGPLCKWTNVVHGWQYRWFVLDKNLGFLSYYTSREKMKRGSRRGCIRLKSAVIGIDDEDESTFTISSDSRTYHFQAQTPKEKDRWVQALDQTVKLFRKTVPVVIVPRPEHHAHWSPQNVLAEAGGYHTLLQEQGESLTSLLSSSTTAERVKIEMKYLLSHSGKFIELLKENETIQPSTVSVISREENYPKKSLSSSASSQSLKSFESVEVEVNNGSSAEHSDSVSEEFFDPIAEISVISKEDPSDVEEAVDLEEEDDTYKGVAQNKSVIMYMLGQVKIGMDLSKVVLPTFILEKRSLLEMFADMFAHPDVVVSIGDFEDPKQRMIEAVKYYLSAFHIAKKGTIAKKPYNPVLGETFECYWDIPGSPRKAPSMQEEELVGSGPVPFAGYGSLAFVAEQVSHHPPVSAFYAENPHKRMTVSGYIYTQSRFLGLSLATHLIGKVHLNLLDRDEEYTGNLPSAYGRSILGTPWMELGGKLMLECKKTGYYATAEFHCKPFYGGKKHRVTADLFHVTEPKRPFMTIEGEWNGVLYKKLPNGSKEEFVNTHSMPVVKKKVRKLERLGELESKRKWKAVTEALLKDDVEAASAAKHEVEEKQRQDVRERKEKGVEWKQQHFHSEGNPGENVWFYNKMLQDRLPKPS